LPQPLKYRVSDNVGGVKFFLSTLRHTLESAIPLNSIRAALDCIFNQLPTNSVRCRLQSSGPRGTHIFENVRINLVTHQQCLFNCGIGQSPRRKSDFYGNAVRPSNGSPWGMRLQLAFLFPKLTKAQEKMMMEQKLKQLEADQEQKPRPKKKTNNRGQR
jgi:hypothetical protein